MKLMTQAGLAPIEVLQCATGNIAAAFELRDAGFIKPGNKADMILIEGRPDQTITDSTKIRQIWIGGKPIM